MNTRVKIENLMSKNVVKDKQRLQSFVEQYNISMVYSKKHFALLSSAFDKKQGNISFSAKCDWLFEESRVFHTFENQRLFTIQPMKTFVDEFYLERLRFLCTYMGLSYEEREDLSWIAPGESTLYIFKKVVSDKFNTNIKKHLVRQPWSKKEWYFAFDANDNATAILCAFTSAQHFISAVSN